MKIFLIQYNHPTGKLMVFEEFDAAEQREAYKKARQLELAMSREEADDNEVVLLDAESRDKLKVTHGRYFMRLREWEESVKRQAAERRHKDKANL